MWGYRQHHCVGVRFTPTRVGNTRIVVTACRHATVHPHACGEYVTSQQCDYSVHATVHPHACGEYPCSCMRIRHVSVHPHACGEYFGRIRSPKRSCGIRRQPVGTPTRVGNTIAVPGSGSTYGSPPHVWGILTLHCVKCRYLSVHPHACGEYEDASACRSAPYGSPPRVWGIQAFIKRMPATAVHPHTCGEYDIVDICTCDHGSPPRVWGIRYRTDRATYSRFTPTRVGNTCNASLPVKRASAVHPHACGEYVAVPQSLGMPAAVHPHACGEYA